MFFDIQNLEQKTIFILETYPEGALPEISSAVHEACREQNWLDNTKNHECKFFRDWHYLDFARNRLPPEQIIPIGSVEFVNSWIGRLKMQNIHALNIPSELDNDVFLGRKVFRAKSTSELDDIVAQYGPLLVKPDRNPKRFEAFQYPQSDILKTEVPDDEPLFASQILKDNIIAEWRVFCQRGRIVDVRPYILDEWVFPSKQKVTQMADALRDYPAVTLDVAVLEDGNTVALEIHNFIACGLYGFGGPKMLRMMKAAWKYELMLQKNEGGMQYELP